MRNISLGWKTTTYLSYTLLLLSTVMNMYALFGDKYLDIYIGYFTILLYCLLKFSRVKTDSREIVIPPELKIFFAYNCLVSLFTSVIGYGDVYSFVSIIIVILLYVVFWDTYRNKKFIKFYVIIAIIAVGFHYFQYIVKFITGVGVSGVLPGIPTSKGLTEDTAYLQQFEMNRFPSFFSEPSHLPQFLAPLLIVLLFDKSFKIKHRNLLIVAILLSFLLLQSGTAIMLLVPSIITYIVDFWKRYKQRVMMRLVVLPLILVVIMGFATWYVSSELGSVVERRASEVYKVSNDDEGTSGFIRMWRGYFVYNDFSSREKIFGTDSFKDILNHVYHSNMELYLDDFALVYFNGIQYILIHSGLIGLLLFLYYVFKQWKNNTVCGKCLLATLLVLMSIDSVYGTGRMATFLLLAQSQKVILKDKNYARTCNNNI